MQRKNLFNDFENGQLLMPDKSINFSDVEWSVHPSFDGVSLKHLITGKDTYGKFSFHLVAIEPGKKIGEHMHKGKLESHEVIAGQGFCLNAGVHIDYKPGVITLFEEDVLHEVHAGNEGLYLFAKFFPALC